MKSSSPASLSVSSDSEVGADARSAPADAAAADAAAADTGAALAVSAPLSSASNSSSSVHVVAPADLPLRVWSASDTQTAASSRNEMSLSWATYLELKTRADKRGRNGGRTRVSEREGGRRVGKAKGNNARTTKRCGRGTILAHKRNGRNNKTKENNITHAVSRMRRDPRIARRSARSSNMLGGASHTVSKIRAKYNGT